MTPRPLEIAMPFLVDRHVPAGAARGLAAAYQQSGVVDYLQAWDQLTGWAPPHLWTPENAAAHAIRPDSDSMAEPYSMLSAMAGAVPGIGTSLSSDAIRRGPTELMQAMLTMANLTEGRAQFHIGAGEIKQMKPYGWNRKEGMKRLEDFLKIAKLYWEQDEVTYEGHYWTLDHATLGGARAYKPQIWAIGGGPKVIDMATTYADGFGTMARWVAPTPERWHELVTEIRAQLERKGRDPDDFSYGVYAASLIHDDPDVIRTAMENPLIKWMTACFGRFRQADWRDEGIEPPLPDKWHYSRNLLAHHMDRGEVDAILGRVTPEMSNTAWLHGTPQQVTDQIQSYIDAGANWVSVIDILPMVLDPAEGPEALGRSLSICGELRAAAGRPISTATAPLTSAEVAPDPS